MSEQPAFHHDDKRGRFVGELDGVEVAFSEVDLIGNESILIKHTEVLAAHEGHGYGSAMLRYILDQARQRGQTVIPICPYSAKFIREHAEYLDLVKPSFRAAMPR
jgi:predicted GNAT family acetyltransferase